jgi:hydrogenase maturation protease
LHGARAVEPPVLVLGYGNPGRGDDGLGPAAAEAIEQLGLPGVLTIAKYQLAIEDASDAAACASVIFVDAARAGVAPFSGAAVLPSAGVTCFASHIVPPDVIIGLCTHVYGRTPDARLIGIRGYAFDFDEGLTQQARANLDLAVAYIRSLLPGGGVGNA